MKRSTWILLGIGLLVQVVTFGLSSLPLGEEAGLALLSLLSGMLGICSVVLGAQGNILTFVFGFAQVGTYAYLSWHERFYGELLLSAYYFLTMIYGVYVWRARLGTKQEEKWQVQPRSMQPMALLLVAVGTVLLSLVAGWWLGRYTDDPQPYMDALTTVPALVAQVLMVMVYREQWYIWMLVDVLATAMWIKAGNYCMAAQYAFWCVNCVYGYWMWRKKN